MEYRLIDGADPWQSVIDAIKDLKAERDALALQLSSARKQLEVLSGQLKTSRETLRHIRKSISELRFTVAKLNDGMGDLVDDLEFWGAVEGWEDDRNAPAAQNGSARPVNEEIAMQNRGTKPVNEEIAGEGRTQHPYHVPVNLEEIVVDDRKSCPQTAERRCPV